MDESDLKAWADALAEAVTPPANAVWAGDLVARSNGMLNKGQATWLLERRRLNGELQSAVYGRRRYYWPADKLPTSAAH